MEEVTEAMKILQQCELHSGQTYNLQKSGIYFIKQGDIKNLLEVYSDLSNRQYLGLPLLIGRSKKWVFQFLKERLWNKLKGWSVKCLSRKVKQYYSTMWLRKSRHMQCLSFYYQKHCVMSKKK